MADRYINADELIRHMINFEQRYGIPMIYQYPNVEEYTKANAADVAPVVHAKWDSNGICLNCGFCRQITRSNNYMVGKYCPNCGAKMDGGETE